MVCTSIQTSCPHVSVAKSAILFLTHLTGPAHSAPPLATLLLCGEWVS